MQLVRGFPQRSKLLRDVVSSLRSIHTARPDLASEKAFQKFKLMQAKMQCNDGRPVYLKRGMRDKVLFGISAGLVLFNTLNTFRMVYEWHKAH